MLRPSLFMSVAPTETEPDAFELLEKLCGDSEVWNNIKKIWRRKRWRSCFILKTHKLKVSETKDSTGAETFQHVWLFPSGWPDQPKLDLSSNHSWRPADSDGFLIAGVLDEPLWTSSLFVLSWFLGWYLHLFSSKMLACRHDRIRVKFQGFLEIPPALIAGWILTLIILVVVGDLKSHTELLEHRRPSRRFPTNRWSEVSGSFSLGYFLGCLIKTPHSLLEAKPRSCLYADRLMEGWRLLHVCCFFLRWSVSSNLPF